MPLVTNSGGGVNISFTAETADLIAKTKQISAELEKLSAQNKTRAKQAEAAAKAEQAAIGKTKMSWTELNSAVMLGKQAIEVVKKGYDFAKQGAQIEFTRSKFDNLTASIGTTSAALMGDLKTATRGTLSDMELMASVTDLVGLGLANSHDEAVRLAAVSAGLGMNMNQLVLTLTNMTTMRFDALGVRVDGFKEKVKALEEQGYSTDKAFKEAFLQQAEAQLLKVGNAADSAAGSFMQFEATVKNLGDQGKRLAADVLGPLVAQLEDELTAGERVRDVMALNNGELRKQYLWGNISKDAIAALADEYGRAKGYGQAWGRALADQTAAITENTTAAELNAEQLKAISDENKQFLDVVGNVQGATEDYETAQAAANQALADGKINAKEHAEKMKELAGTYEEAKNKIILSIVEMKLASDGWTDAELRAYLNIGQQLGQFDTDMVTTTNSYIAQADKLVAAGGNQELMYKRLAGRSEDAREEFVDMKQAQANLADDLRRDAIPAVGALNVALAGLKDEQVYVDIYFRQHGRPSNLGGGQGHNQETSPGGPLSGGYAEGGQLKHDLAIVGDAPGGVWTPYTEVVVNGKYVLDAQTSRKMKDAGLLDGAQAFAFGGEIESPWVIGGGTHSGGGGGPIRPPTRSAPGRAGSTNSGGASSDVLMAEAQTAAQTTAALLAPELQQASDATTYQAAQAAAASREQARLLQETNKLLKQLVGKTPTVDETARATQAAANRIVK